MDSSITMQFVMMRAQAELAAGNDAELAVEHVFLGILKLAELQPKDITPKEKYHSGIKEDIRQVRALLSEAGIDSSRARGQLRGMLRSYRFPENRNIQAEMTSMMNTASQVAAAMGSEELTAAMALTVLLNDPIGVIGEVVPQSGNKAVLQNGEPVAAAAVPMPKSKEQMPEAASEMGLSFLPELTARIRTMRSKLLSTVCGQDHVVQRGAVGVPVPDQQRVERVDVGDEAGQREGVRVRDVDPPRLIEGLDRHAGAQTAAGRQPERRVFERDAEDIREHQAEPENRHRDADVGPDHGADVDGGVVVVRRERAERDAHHDRDHHGVERQLDGDGQPFDEQLIHRAAELARLAEIATQHVADVDAELLGDRVVQPVTFIKRVTDRFGGTLAQRRPAGIAGQQAGQAERYEQNAQQDRDR